MIYDGFNFFWVKLFCDSVYKFSLTRFVRERFKHNNVLQSQARFTLVSIQDVLLIYQSHVLLISVMFNGNKTLYIQLSFTSHSSSCHKSKRCEATMIYLHHSCITVTFIIFNYGVTPLEGVVPLLLSFSLKHPYSEK